MKTAISITLIITGALFVLAPIVVEHMGRTQTEGDAVTISISGKKPWGSTAVMSIGTIIIGLTALASVKKEKEEEPIYIHKENGLGDADSSIRGELQRPAQAPPIPIRSFGSAKPGSEQTSNLKEQA